LEDVTGTGLRQIPIFWWDSADGGGIRQKLFEPPRKGQRRGATVRPGEFLLSSAGVAESHQKIVGFDVSLDFFCFFFLSRKKRRRIGYLPEDRAQNDVFQVVMIAVAPTEARTFLGPKKYQKRLGLTPNPTIFSVFQNASGEAKINSPGHTVASRRCHFSGWLKQILAFSPPSVLKNRKNRDLAKARSRR